MKLISHLCFLVFMTVIMFSCREKTICCAFPPPIQYVETKLDSNWIYQVTIPENYRIEKKGFIDYFVYSIIGPESDFYNFGTAEIHYSKNMDVTLQGPSLFLHKDSSTNGEVLNIPVTWNIFHYDSKVFAETIIDEEDIGIKVTSTNLQHLDSLIRMVSSLKKEK